MAARLPKFLHVMAVNRVAKTGQVKRMEQEGTPEELCGGTQWTSMLAEENTGTGNSQWIVVDYNRPGLLLLHVYWDESDYIVLICDLCLTKDKQVYSRTAFATKCHPNSGASSGHDASGA